MGLYRLKHLPVNAIAHGGGRGQQPLPRFRLPRQHQCCALDRLSRSALPAPRQDAHHFTRTGTGHEATPIIGVGKAACVQVVDGLGDPGGATNQQDPHLLLVGC